jgi:DNA-binding beta-propeller fold protein YncE
MFELRKVLFACLILILAAPLVSGEEAIYVATTDYSTGKLSWLEPDDPWTVTNDVATLHSDMVIRWHDGLVWIVGRMGSDTIRALDPADNYSTVIEFSVGSGSNPQDIAFSPDGSLAYISLQNRDEVLIVDPSTGVTQGAVDLSPWADADGSAEPGQMVATDGKIFVAILRLDRDYYWSPVGDSYLAVIDALTGELIDINPDQAGVQAIPLWATNPAWELELGPDGLIYLACVGYYGLQDGGVERVDPATLASLGVLVPETALGGDVGDVCVVDEHTAYVVVSDASYNTHLKRFDTTSGGGVQLVTAGSGYAFTDLEVDSSGDLYVCDRSYGASGVRVYDAVSGVQVTGTLPVGLAPYDILVPDDGGVAVPDQAPLAAAGLRSWPNPFNPRTTIAWGGLPAGEATLTIHSVDGRLVSYRNLGHTTGAGTIIWKAQTDQGEPLAGGVYVARVSGGGRSVMSRLILIK